MVSPTFAFNALTEPSTNATPSVPAGFNVNIAWLLGQCCNITYQDYNQDTPPDLTSLTLGSSATISATVVKGFTASEANGPAATVADPGDYTTFPAGFAAVISVSNPPAGVPPEFIVVALRGTQTWEEWIEDVEAYPTFFAGGNSKFSTVALAHDGFYALYTVGLLGADSASPLDPLAANRSNGSIAQQVASYFAGAALPANLPVYVTGHSLGGALAPYCAWDIAAILVPSIEGIAMYSLAAPRCAMGFDIPKLSAIIDIPPDSFLQGYQAAVRNSFRIVHTCDIAPVLPPSTIVSNKFFSLTMAHVTDAWVYGGQSGSLAENVVAFAAQTGDIGGNHSCAFTYLPFLTALAAGFPA
jgi:hypothetical protein